MLRILIATPSGVLRHTDPFLLANVRTCVVDEADMLLDGGYLDDVEKVLNELCPRVSNSMKRRAKKEGDSALKLPREPAQVVFAAATLPDWKGDKVRSVVRWIKKMFPDAAFVRTEELHTQSSRAEQEWIEVNGDDNAWLFPALEKALEKHRGKRTMVFVNKVQTAIDAHEFLKGGNFRDATVLHRDMPQIERAEAIATFRAGLSNILVSTDVGARGLDIAKIHHIVQLQLATNAITHLHRIGRTARAGEEGFVTNVVSPASKEMADAIRQGGEGPLAPIFSRNRGFKRRIKRKTGYGKGDARAVLEGEEEPVLEGEEEPELDGERAEEHSR